MKNTLYALVVVTSLLGLAACEYDNYEEPEALLQGALIDTEGDTIQVGYLEVSMRLFEVPAYASNQPIIANFAPNGTYSSLLFPATYKLVFPQNSGPFMPIEQSETLGDTIVVDVNGSKTFNIVVMPYYKIHNALFSADNNIVTALFDLEKIIKDENAKDIENVSLYLNKTIFVGQGNNAAATSINGADLTAVDDITLQLEVPSFTPSQNYVFARIGVKLVGVEDRLYSSVKRIEL